MNTSLNIHFQESILLVDYVINMALVELSELDQQAIKNLQSIPEYEKDIIQVLEGMASAKKSLNQARETARRLINPSIEVKS